VRSELRFCLTPLAGGPTIVLLMRVRIANGLLLAAVLVFITGTAGFLIGSAPVSWAEVADGARWSVEDLWARRLSLLPLGVVVVVLELAWLGLALRNRARFRAEAAARATTSHVPSSESRLRRARRRLDEGLRRMRRTPEAGLEALLGALVDLEALELTLEPGEMLATASLLLEDQSRPPLGSLTQAQVQAVLAQAELVSGVSAGEDGELTLHSPGGTDRIRLHLSEGPLGPVLQLRPMAVGEGDGESTGPLRRHPSMVLRLDTTPPVRRPTGELSQPGYPGPDDTTDSNLAVLAGLEPSAESEIAPVVPATEPRPVGGLEAGVRLGSSLLVLIVLCLVFVPGQVWALRRLLGGQVTAPWREVSVLVRSRPSGARIDVDGETRGRTALRFVEPCGGRRLQIVVAAPGHSVWQWTGICPRNGELLLYAELQPLHP